MAKRRSLDYNYAQDQEFAQDLVLNLLDIYHMVVNERRGREEVWDESYRAWSLDGEGDSNYEGMSNLYIPQLRKEVETMTRRIKKGMFPEDYLRAEASRFESEDIVLTNTQIVRHYLDNVMIFKQSSEPWIKQGVLYGTSPLRTFWDKKSNQQFLRERYFVETKEGILEPKFRTTQREVVRYNAPVARAEDLYQTHVYPTNVTDQRDIKIHFFKTKILKSDLEKKQKDGSAVRLDEIKEQAKDTDHQFEESQRRLADIGESGELRAIQDDGMFDLLECWLETELPDGECAPIVVEIINEQIATRIQRNGYWHQQAPFDWFRYIIPPPGEWYGRGMPEAGLGIQHQLNDTANQGMDSATLALNNITIINPAYAPNAESFEIEPRAIWWADPAGVKQMQFPDLSDTSIKNMGVLRGMITELSDNSPQLPDPIAGKARSTGQAQLAINEWQTDLFNFLDNMSIGLQSMAQKIHSLLQQNLSDDEVIKITGKYADTWINRVVTPEDIIGQFDWHWIGSLQIESNSVKTQQMLNFVKVYQTLPPEAQQQLKIKWPNFFIKLFRDGFLIKDAHNIIETERLNASTPPNIEGRIMKQGGMVQVEKTDDDPAHIAYHRRDLQASRDPYTRYLFIKHIGEHESQMAAKAEAAKQAQALQSMMMQQAQLQSGKAKPGGQQTAGNLGQITDSTDQADILRGQRA